MGITWKYALIEEIYLQEVKKSIYFTVAQICTQESNVDFGKSYLGEDVHFEITDDVYLVLYRIYMFRR